MATPQSFDVWFVTADQVYKGVPYQVLAGWVEQGRVSGADKVRPAGSTAAWGGIAEHPLLRDYLTAKAAPPLATALDGRPQEPVEAPEPEMSFKHGEDDDDDVDMIPLIDISLVLLIFFMMTTAVSALSPVDVPGISAGSEMSQDAEALTVQIDRRDSGEAYYAVRVGDGSILPENNNLETKGDLLNRMAVILGGMRSPPEVRIACHKLHKHVLVREVAVELERLRQKGQITSYRAEVNEQPKQ